MVPGPIARRPFSLYNERESTRFPGKTARGKMNSMQNILNNSALYIDRSVLVQNISAIERSLSPGAKIIPVLKGDAYGLGMEKLAETLSPLPSVHSFAVAHAWEGIRLREAGVEKEILLLGQPVLHAVPAAAEADLTFTVGRLALAESLAGEGRRLGRSVKVQLKVDTGLHRLGVAPGEELAALLAEVAAAGENLSLRGVFSHFADTGDPALCRKQYELYLRSLDQVEAAGVSVPLRHICDSAGSEAYPEYHLDAVRLGRRLIMDNPDHPTGDIREIASWRTSVTMVHRRAAGEKLGYGGSYTLHRDSVVAVIGVGYGDGLIPAWAERHAPVLIRGQRCPVLACCMDQAMVDVTDLAGDVAPGEEVTLFGDGLSSQEIAALTLANEGCGITTAIPARAARVYL